MKLTLLIFVLFIVLVSCEKDEDKESFPPSVVEFEIQTYGNLSSDGTVFGSKQTLTRKTYEYLADDEHGMHVYSGFELDDGIVVQGFQSFGNNIHPAVKHVWLRIPDNGIGSYSYNPDTSDDKHFWLRIETTSDSELRAGQTNVWGSPKTNLSVNIEERTETKIKGSFSGELVYYNKEESSSGAISLTMDDEITNVNTPVINGTFEIYTLNE